MKNTKTAVYSTSFFLMVISIMLFLASCANNPSPNADIMTKDYGTYYTAEYSFTSFDEYCNLGYTKERVLEDFTTLSAQYEKDEGAHYIFSHVDGKSVSRMVGRVQLWNHDTVKFILELDKQGQYGGSIIMTYRLDNQGNNLDMMISPSVSDDMKNLYDVDFDQKIVNEYDWWDIIILELEDGSYYNINAKKTVANSLEELRTYYNSWEWQRESKNSYIN